MSVCISWDLDDLVEAYKQRCRGRVAQVRQPCRHRRGHLRHRPARPAPAGGSPAGERPSRCLRARSVPDPSSWGPADATSRSRGRATGQARSRHGGSLTLAGQRAGRPPCAAGRAGRR